MSGGWSFWYTHSYYDFLFGLTIIYVASYHIYAPKIAAYAYSSYIMQMKIGNKLQHPHAEQLVTNLF